MNPYHPGDLLFFYGTDLTSKIIEWGTWGPSHVGIIFLWQGRPLIVESTTLCDLPCIITGRTMKGVQAHPIEDRVRFYKGRVTHVAIRKECKLDNHECDVMTRATYGYIGMPYDMSGAIESGTNWLKYLGCNHPDLGTLFCSALAARLLMLVNRMNWASPKLYNPANLLRSVLKTATHEAERKLK